jgi:hypothetical protein
MTKNFQKEPSKNTVDDKVNIEIKTPPTENEKNFLTDVQSIDVVDQKTIISDSNNKVIMSSKGNTESEKNNQKTKAPKLTKINQGDLLEFRAKRLLFYMGYFPTRGVKVRTSLESFGEDITDLDVYGVYIHKDFRQKTVWVDCKSGAAKPLERISWMKGIKDVFPVDDTLFIKNGIRGSVKHFARKAGIEVLDSQTLDKIEKDYNIDSEKWLGSWNPYVMNNKINEFAKLKIPNNDIYKKIANLISSEFWARDNYTKIKKCITALRELAKIPTTGFSKEEEITFRWGIYELVTLFTLSVLSICKELYYYNFDDRRSALYEGLLSSDIPLKKRTEILQAAYRLAYEMIKSKYPEANPTMEKVVNIQPPEYFEALLDLISRIIDNPNTYYDILRPLDIILMEFRLLDKKYNPEKISGLFTNFENNVIGFKTIFHFIHQVTQIPKEFFLFIS